MEELQILLAPDKEHQKVFPYVPIVGFHNGKSLKDHLVRASLPSLNQTLGSESCGKRNCQVCQFTDTCSLITTDEALKVLKINKGPLNCNSKNDWQFTLIDQCTTNDELEVYWQHCLKTFFPNSLNEHEESCL